MTIQDTLQSIASVFVSEIKASMATAGLEGSSLQQSVVGTTEGSDTIRIDMNEYGQWVISGRKPSTKKVPIAALLQWIKTKNIQSDLPELRLAFAIQNSIYKIGIRSRDFLTGTIIETYDTASEMLLEALHKELEQVLQQEFANG